MKTWSARKCDLEKKWFLIDADGLVLGRVAALIARILRGKHKPTYTPHMDCGDYVVVVNVDKIKLTGNKLKDKVYYRHTGYPGGIKSVTAGELMKGRFPERVLTKAVERMLPRGPLFRDIMTHLRLFSGSEHTHEAQSPVVLDVAAMNRKNQGKAA